MHPSEHSRAARLTGPVGLAVLTIGGLLALSCVGLATGMQLFLGPVSLITLLCSCGGIALAYLLGAFGLGRPLAFLLAKNSPHRLWIQLGLGIALMLWLSHLMGVLGLLSGPGMRPRLAGWGVIALGLLLLLDQVIRGDLRPERWPVLPASSILWSPGLALLLIAAASPPGMLWGPASSEHGAYDALSYHLQLPKEWAAGPRLWPNDHNVYSYLPSLVEAAYLHLGAMMVAVPNALDPVQRMLGAEGNWVIACQYLHAGLAIAAALLTARVAWILARRCEANAQAARILAVLAGAFILCTPWVLVVGSLPYNEAGLLVLAALGLLVALDTSISPWSRGAAAGLAVGIACGCKPTALFMIGPLVGLLLLGDAPAKSWHKIILSGTLTGSLAIAPWLVRNYLACGNPVFPFAAGLFGTGHWTAEQIARHNQNHHAPPGLTIGGRLSRLFDSDFGLAHPQWGIVLAATFLALTVALAWQPARRIAALLSIALIAQALCWMALTHLQSRFLLPLLTPAALLLTLAGAALIAWMSRPAAPPRLSPLAGGALVVLALAPLSQAFRSALIFLQQNNGLPNQGLILGVGPLTGLSVEDALKAAQDPDRANLLHNLGPTAFINLVIRPQDTADSGVYLLGDATPLYLLGATGDAPPRDSAASLILYHTTWDTPSLLTPPVHLSANVHPWSASLRERGVRFVLVNYAELDRLIDKSHYFDPRLSLDAIRAWLRAPEAHLRSLRTWPPSGHELFEIDLTPIPASSAPRTPDPANDRPRP